MRLLNNMLFLAVSLILFISATAVCADERVSIKAGYQLLSPQGSLTGSTRGDTRLNLKRDLDLDDSSGLTGELALNWGRSRLSLNYLPISFSGTSTIKIDGAFGGQPFSVGDTVKSDLEIALYDIGYSYYLLNFDTLPIRFQLGPELAIKIADTDVLFRNLDPAAGYTERESALVPIPTIGLRSRIALADFLGVVARVGYMKYRDNHFMDAEAQLEYSPLPLFGIYAGYRYFDLKIDESDVNVETEFSGPFGGLMVRF